MKRFTLTLLATVLLLVMSSVAQVVLTVPPGGVLMPNVPALSATPGIFSCASYAVNSCQWVDYSGTVHAFGSGGGGNVSNSGTPLVHQLGVWVTATTIKGIGVGTTGQCLQGVTGADPAFSTCPSGFTAGGDLSGTSSSQSVIGINGTLLSGLGTGAYWFTAGVPALATAANLISLWTSCSGTQYLGADGACHTASGGTGTASTWFGPKANLGVGQGAVTLGATTGCSLVGSFPATGPPIFYGIAATTTYRQTCRPQFTVNGTNSATTTTTMYYADTISDNYVSNHPLVFRFKAFHAAAVTGADTFGLAVTCTNATSELAFSTVQNFAAVTVIGTAGGASAGQNEEQVELTLTPGSGGIPACTANDTIQMSPTLVSTTASDNPVVTFFGGRQQ